MLYILYFLCKIKMLKNKILYGEFLRNSQEADNYFNLYWQIKGKNALAEALTAPILRSCFSESLLRELVSVEPITEVTYNDRI